MRRYTWEIQRQWFAGLWSHQHILGEPEDPRGYEQSDLEPAAFARQIADRHKPGGRWRVVVWDTLSVGYGPVAELDGVEEGCGGVHARRRDEGHLT